MYVFIHFAAGPALHSACHCRAACCIKLSKTPLIRRRASSVGCTKIRPQLKWRMQRTYILKVCNKTSLHVFHISGFQHSFDRAAFALLLLIKWLLHS